MRKKYVVDLTAEERGQLAKLVSSGRASSRTLAKAHILLKADCGGPSWTDAQISSAFDVSSTMIERVRRRYAENGLKDALQRRKPRRQYDCRLDGRQEAHLIALACGSPPQGHGRWSLRLLADKLVELQIVDRVSYETVRRRLKKTNSSLG